ncbi:MAG: radical SAM protein [Pelobacteraceae bacterium]
MDPSELTQLLKSAGLRPPGMLTLAITGACNLKCCHCWVEAGAATSHAHVPLRTVRRLIEEFAAIGGEGVRITGGEPLSHPHWLEIIQLACSLGFKKVVLQTNAMLLRDKHLAPLLTLNFPGLTIQISLDGILPQTHDLVRGEGAYNGALHGIEMLVQAGLAPNIAIFLTEMRHNLHEIPELLEFADRSGIGSVSTGAMVLCGRASETSLIAPPTVEQYLSLLERYERDDHFRELYDKIGTVAALEWRKDSSSRQECCTFIENPYITPSGILYPCLMCHTDEYSVTEVFEKELGAAFAEGVPLWSSLHTMSRCRPDVIPECRDCSEKTSCAGGCMGRAWGSCGNLLAVDDRCKTRQAIGKYRNKQRT